MNWIISAILVIGLYAIVFMKKYGLINGNPINTITYKGCLGLFIGMDKDKAIKQIKGLNLEISEDDTDDVITKRIGGLRSIVFAPNTFNNIKYVRLSVNELNIVYFISICIHSIEYDIETYKRSVVVQINKRLGRKVFTKYEKNFVWNNRKNQVIVFDEEGYVEKGTFNINIHRIN